MQDDVAGGPGRLHVGSSCLQGEVFRLVSTCSSSQSQP